MDDVVFVVLYRVADKYTEFVSAHKTEDGANASRDKMNSGNTQLTCKYVVDTVTLEK